MIINQSKDYIIYDRTNAKSKSVRNKFRYRKKFEINLFFYKDLNSIILMDLEESLFSSDPQIWWELCKEITDWLQNCTICHENMMKDDNRDIVLKHRIKFQLDYDND